jgi:hypothetical protein
LGDVGTERDGTALITAVRWRPELRHAVVRVFVAATLAAGAAGLARAGGAPLATALALAAGAAAFAAWQTVWGVCAGFLLMLAAATAAMGGRSDPAGLGVALPALAGVEAYGLTTVWLVSLVRRPRQVSRRLLGAWLATSGLVAVGLALATRAGTQRLGSVLLVGGLAHRIGVVPAYAWAPMLLRHPSRRITVLGVIALAAGAATLALVLSRLPAPDEARVTLQVLSVCTFPWAVWRAARQWRRDPPCARTYVVVAVTAAGVLLGVRG